jgi:hypothetical protein
MSYCGIRVAHTTPNRASERRSPQRQRPSPAIAQEKSAHQDLADLIGGLASSEPEPRTFRPVRIRANNLRPGHPE